MQKVIELIEIKLLEPMDSQYLNNVADDVFDDPIVESAAQEFLNDPRHRLAVALDNNTVVGFVSVVVYLHPDKPAPELWINEIGVAPMHQQQGIGKRLLQAILEDARQAGCTEAWVLTERKMRRPWPCTDLPAEAKHYQTRQCLHSFYNPGPITNLFSLLSALPIRPIELIDLLQ